MHSLTHHSYIYQCTHPTTHPPIRAQVDLSDLLENFPEEFHQHEHVELLVAPKPSANGHKSMRCANGMVLRVENNIYDVLDLEGESSQPSVHRVHSQVGAKRGCQEGCVLVAWGTSNAGHTRAKHTHKCTSIHAHTCNHTNTHTLNGLA